MLLEDHRKARSATPLASDSAQPPNVTRKRSAPASTISEDKSDLYNRRTQRKLSHVTSHAHVETSFRSCYDDPEPPSQQVRLTAFSVFSALLQYPELTFEMVKHLTPRALLTLYSTSRDFHNLANTRFTTMILSLAHVHAPESAIVFPFRCYRSLCIRDPASRPNAATSIHNLPKETRFVPGFRYLHMVLHREQCVHNIVTCLERESLMLPARATLTIKKIWFTIDLPTNAQRNAIMRNMRFWSEQDLYVATLFIMKLDMIFTCPMTGNGDLGLRKMLFAQRSLTTLASVLKREAMRTPYEMLRMIIKFSYTRTARQRARNLPMLGVKPAKIGILQYEGWGAKPGVLFQQADELVVMESVRRGLDMPRHYLDMIFYGFVDKGPGLDIWTVEQRRRRESESEFERGRANVA